MLSNAEVIETSFGVHVLVRPSVLVRNSGGGKREGRASGGGSGIVKPDDPEHPLSSAIAQALSGGGAQNHLLSRLAAIVLQRLLILVIWLPAAAWLACPFALLALTGDIAVLIGSIWLIVTVGLLLWLLDGLRLRPAKGASHRPGVPVRPFRKVAVIGAGPVGLATIKELRAQGIACVCYESRDGLGGAFRYSPDRPGGVWESARLTTSPWVTAYSDFAPESDDSTHWHHSEYLAYLDRYAARHDLGESLLFRHRVTAVTPSGRQWRLTVRDDSSGEVFTEDVDAVAVCAGLSAQPKPIDIPGLELCSARLRSAADYKGPAQYRNQRVMVVGLGESAADIAYEIAGVARRVLLSARRGKFLIPRVNPRNGMANDYDTNRLRYATPLAVRNAFMRLRRSLCAWRGEMDPASRLRYAFLAASDAGAMSQTVTKSDDFLAPLAEGRLETCPEIARFDERGAVLRDGRHEALDAVVFAHGYLPSWPFLHLPGEAKPRHPEELYLRMFDPQFGPSLAFLGYARPAIGSIPVTGEMQARYFALVAAGARQLPDRQSMKADVEAARAENARAFPTMAKPNAIIEWIPYLDRIAGLIGCRPEPWRLLRRPHLLWKIATGPMTGAMYRLHGPGASPEQARRTLLRLPRGHEVGELLTMVLLQIYSAPWAALSGDRNLRRGNEFL